MKKVVRVILFLFFLVGCLSFSPSLSSLLLLVGAVLLFPMGHWQSFIKERLRLKTGIRALILVVLFFAAVMTTPESATVEDAQGQEKVEEEAVAKQESVAVVPEPEEEQEQVAAESEPEDEPTPEPEQEVTFEEMYETYKSNKLVAEEKYKGNRYTITAKINGMSTSGLLNLTGGATLTMETLVGNTIVLFRAEFEEEQEDELKKIVVGDTITFEGTCTGSCNFYDCEIVW